MTLAMHPFMLLVLLGLGAPPSWPQESAREERQLLTVAAQVRKIEVDDAFDGTVPLRIRRLLSNPSESLATMKDRIATDLGRHAESAAAPRESQSPSIAGQVMDASGRRVPGVSVIALHDSGGVAARATTGSDGMYKIDALPDA